MPIVPAAHDRVNTPSGVALVVGGVGPVVGQVKAATPLVKVAKLLAAGTTTGTQPTTPGDDDEKKRLARAERYVLKGVAECVLCEPGQDKARGTWGRLFRCNRYRLGQEVTLVHNKGRKTASYQGVESCSSVWVCSVCSAKITERRRLELVEAVEKNRAKGGACLFGTITFPHYASDVLVTILDDFIKAFEKLGQDWTFRKAKARFGWVGQVRALETTHGRVNGWHPHGHLLIFLERELSELEVRELEEVMFQVWCRKLALVGLPQPKRGIGVQLERATASTEELVAKYMSKFGHEPKKAPRWTATHEMAKGAVKLAAAEGRTPFQLLRELAVEWNDQDAGLFREFAEAFKGKQLLAWSKGLRAKLGMGVEATDEEVAEETEDNGNEDLVSFDAQTWGRIVRAKAWSEVLEAGSTGELEAVWRVIEGLPDVERGEALGLVSKRRVKHERVAG